MNFMFVVFLFLSIFISNAFALFVETLDEQISSNNINVLRLRLNNQTSNTFSDVCIKYFLKNNFESLTVDSYDLGKTKVRLDTINEEILALTIAIDSLPPGIFPYEAGISLGIHNRDWSTRNKHQDPSYIASSNFTVNNKVELTINGNHLPNATPLTLGSGIKILLNEDDSVSFAWHNVLGAEKYRLSIFSLDSQLIYQNETYGNREAVVLGAGDYLWKVEAKNKMTNYSAIGDVSLVNYLSVENFHLMQIQEQISHGIESVSGYKDTPMLVVGWGEYADLRGWDRLHLDREFMDENEAFSCWAIAIKNLNKFYGGNLSLDEIRWFSKKQSPGIDSINAFRFLLEAGGGIEEIGIGLNYALDSTTNYKSIRMSQEPLTYFNIKKYLNNNQEIYINMSWPNCINCYHAMLIDSYYTTTNGNFIRCVNIDNYGNYGIFLADSLLKTVNSYFIIDKPKTVRNMSHLLGVEKSNGLINWIDSDNDGITDFDEVYRFMTKPDLADSDSDGVNDKDEIYSYTILEKTSLNLNGSYEDDNVDLSQIRLIEGINSEYMADIDGDGLRAELDSDSDNDNLIDGEDSEPYRAKDLDYTLGINELPKDVVLYALNKLKINDGVTCESSVTDICIYASEDVNSDYGMIMGARALAAHLYAKNKVLIRSNPNNTFAVNYYGSNNLTTERPDGKLTIDKNFSADKWPWNLNISLPLFDEGDSVLVVHQGDTCILNDDDHFKMLKVESGGVVYLPAGNVFVGDLQLDAGSAVGFVSKNKNTSLFVKGKVLWKSSFFYKTGMNFSYDTVASLFRFIYSGTENIFFNTNWYGTIIAPNAKIILGQTHYKNIYGQLLAKEIVIHQYAYIRNVPFYHSQGMLEYVLNGQTNIGDWL